MEQPAKQESSINSIGIFKEIPNSEKITKKTAENSPIVKCPTIGKAASLKVPHNPAMASRKKVESLISRILRTNSSRGQPNK